MFQGKSFSMIVAVFFCVLELIQASGGGGGGAPGGHANNHGLKQMSKTDQAAIAVGFCFGSFGLLVVCILAGTFVQKLCGGPNLPHTDPRSRSAAGAGEKV